MAVATTQGDTPWVDTRKLPSSGAAPGTADASTSYNSVAQMRARLTAINSTYFNNQMLNTMTDNDMIYAIRKNDDAAGF